MAAKRSQSQLDEAAAFVRELYARSGAATWSEFAGLAGLPASNVSNYQTGKAMPEGWNLYRLIRAAANGRAEARSELAIESAAAIGQESLDVRLQRLEAQVGTLARAESVETGFRALRAAIERLAPGQGGRDAETESGP